jgi:O-methyltransferase involved in polyketide biosynthesis
MDTTNKTADLRYATISGGQMRYLRTGSGRPIVFLHTLRTQLDYSLPLGQALGQGFDVDFPDVIDLRRQLFPERDGAYHLIGAPLADLRWLGEVPRDRSGLLIAEGVLHYVSPPEVKALLTAVVAHFPSGQLIFDICNTFIVKRTGSNVGGAGAASKWGLDDPQDVKRLEPKLELVKEYRQSEQVAFDRFPLWFRVPYRLQELNPILRRLERIMLYRF